MNRFLSKKKGPDDASSINSAPGMREGRRKTKKGRKVQEEPKLQFDLSTALPTTADLRTSLLMPNLSARFSMLREQDDPNSKLGKASDDSVLYPRRQSRLMDFGYSSSRNGLTDIAEVASVNSSARRPWLNGQHDSFVSDDSFGNDGESVNGSIMARARPGEGNVLFGGRQKVYKIPDSASTKSLQTGPSMGKLVYDDDISQSAFQKFKASEKAKEEAARKAAEDEVRRLEDYNSFAFGLPSSHTGYTAAHPQPSSFSQDAYSSPNPSGYRGASLDSSAASETAQDHNTTPATSVGSQHFSSPSNNSFTRRSPNGGTLERSMTKRKLYEQSLDQNMQEQQYSQLTRLNSIQRQRQFSGSKSPGPGLSYSKSASNLHEHTYQPYAAGNHSPIEHLTTFDNMGSAHATSPSPPSSHPQSPSFLPLHDYDDSNPLAAAILPGDRGKATAMGAFEAPKQPFDEDQYLERLQRLQRSQSPTPVREKPLDQAIPPQPSRFEDAPRMSIDDDNTDRKQHSSTSTVESEPPQTSAFSVFQNAAAQMRSQPPEKNGQDQRHAEPAAFDTHRTFFGDISPSDDDEEDPYDFERRSYYNSRYRPGGLENIEEYPSRQATGFPEIREEEEEDEYVLPVQPLRTKSSKPSLADSATGSDDANQLPATVYTQPPPPVPRLPQQVEEPRRALGGLVHQHLRNTSNVSSSAASTSPTREHGRSHYRDHSGDSSIYPSTVGREDSAATFNDATSQFSRRTYNSENRLNNKFTHSNPWDLDEAEHNSGAYGSMHDDKTGMAALSRTDTRKPPVQQLGPEDNTGTGADSSWRPDHQRDISEGTLLERQAFDNELAARQKAIQENLKSMVVVDSRGGSPTPTSNGAFKAFNMLRPKSSRDSILKPEVAPSKAMKMLGLGSPASVSGSSVSRKSSVAYEDGRPSTDRVPSLPGSQWPAHNTPPPAAFKNAPMDNIRSRAESESSVSARVAPVRPSPPSSTIQSRNRSDSTTSGGRGLGRQEKGHDDAYDRRPSTANAGQHAASPRYSPNSNNNFAPTISPHFTPQQSPSLNQRQQSPAIGWSGPPDRSQPLGISNAPTHTAFNPGPPPPVPTSRASPMKSPSQAPYFANPTPPASGHTTPTTFNPASPPAPHIPIIKQHGAILRKKTISKMEISDPVLIMSTSNIDTVDLPPGASLRNGMETAPVPAAQQPRRKGTTKKLFGFGKDTTSDNMSDTGRHRQSPPPLPSGGSMRSPEPLRERAMEQAYRSTTSSQGSRSDVRAGPSSDSLNRMGGPTSPPMQRPIMTQGNMF